MADHDDFTGFFSYAHDDAETERTLIIDLTTQLERRVSSRLTNARFTIWRDEEGLRTGEIWNDKIEDKLRRADLLVVLLTPRWVGSDYCRKEYQIFEEVELSRTVGEYIVPIMGRSIDQQVKYFNSQQRDTYARIRKRQLFTATGFAGLTRRQRNVQIEKIADDIAGGSSRCPRLINI